MKLRLGCKINKQFKNYIVFIWWYIFFKIKIRLISIYDPFLSNIGNRDSFYIHTKRILFRFRVEIKAALLVYYLIFPAS